MDVVDPYFYKYQLSKSSRSGVLERLNGPNNENNMNYEDDFSLPIKLLEQVKGQGSDFQSEIICVMVNMGSGWDKPRSIGFGA